MRVPLQLSTALQFALLHCGTTTALENSNQHIQCPFERCSFAISHIHAVKSSLCAASVRRDGGSPAQ